MVDDDRATKALRLLAKLCDALERRGTEQDGNWGHPSFAEEIAEIKTEIAASLKPL